jgi:YD repeat-containing protein
MLQKASIDKSKENNHLVIQLLKKFVCAVLIFSFLSLSTPAASETIVGATAQTWQDIRFSFLSSQLAIDAPNWLAFFAARKTATDSPADISRIQIYPAPSDPGPMRLERGQEVVFSAVAFDSDNEPLSGIDFRWSAVEPGSGRAGGRLLGSVYHANRLGSFVIKANAGGYEAQIRVVVTPETGIRPPNTPTRSTSSRTGLGPIIATTDTTEIKAEPDETKNIKAQEKDIQVDNLLPGEGWGDDNWTSADDPGNQTGNPPGSPADDGAGNGNFQISAPVVSLPGRGIDLALNLNYNSRVWNKSGTQVAYDIDYGSPAPGWSLGFGHLAIMGSQGGCMLVDADGTRHGYSGSVSSWSTGYTFTGHTTDGTFIDYGCSLTYGQYSSGWAKLPNGTSIIYTPGYAHIYPSRITDAQGNHIDITRYGPGIQTITDTMGRVITFHYDTLGRLIEIKAPRMTGQNPIYGTATTRTLVKLHYKPLTLNYSFAPGITPVVRPGTIYGIDSIYYPATNTGYWFNDADSYSSYGMITKVVEQRGMSWAAGPDEQGTITPGTMTKQADYNYPLTNANLPPRTNGVGLSDAPTYTELKESWAGADVAGTAITTYSLNNSDFHWDGYSNSPSRTVTVTQPTGVISKQYSYRTPAAWTDGLVFADETITVSGSTQTVVAASNVSWQQGQYDTARPSWVEATDENGHKVKTVYTYGSGKFNQITRSCDYDNSQITALITPLRCSTADYENDPSYTGSFNSTTGQFIGGRHIFNLVKSTTIEDLSGVKVSRTDYEYDNYAAQPFTNAPGVIQHDFTHDYFTTVMVDGPNCIEWEPLECRLMAPCQICLAWEQVNGYKSTTEKRGNITKVTTYADAQNLTGAIIETRAYDITGNVVKASSACCEQTSILYDDPNTVGVIDTQYAYPVSQTRGAVDINSLHRITTTQVPDFSTGLIKSATDANGRTSTTGYNPDTMRPDKSTSSTGAYTTFTYDEAAMTVTEEVKEANGTVAGKSKKYLNGLGQVSKTESFAPGGIIDIVETKYTKFGEEWKTSRPYRTGQTVYWSEKFYDLQRRLKKVVEPDGSTTEAFYNEATLPIGITAQPGNRIRVMDAWGRERWGRYDQQGRLIQVVEPNPNRTANPTGSIFATGSLLTTYGYDTLGRLVQTDQGVQQRKFKYDSLGRLTRQKLAEQTATLNDAGTYVGSGGTGANWANAFFYDNRSNLTQKTDARGIKAKYSFQFWGGGDDPLNRLQRIEYDTAGPKDTSIPINSAPASNFTYMTTGDKMRVQEIDSEFMVNQAYTYDVEGRVSKYTQKIKYRESYPMEVDYLYDTLDRVKEVTYPAQYGIPAQGGNPANPRKIVAHSYDTASRLTGMTYGTAISSTQHAGNVVYNASDQTTQIKIGAAGTNQVTEDYTFDPQTGLLTNQKATKNGSLFINLSYNYARNNSVGTLNGKTGHLTKITDNLNTQKNREYEFDVLGRLTKAKGGPTGTLWTQTYTFDRWGNRHRRQDGNSGGRWSDASGWDCGPCLRQRHEPHHHERLPI